MHEHQRQKKPENQQTFRRVGATGEIGTGTSWVATSQPRYRKDRMEHQYSSAVVMKLFIPQISVSRTTLPGTLFRQMSKMFMKNRETKRIIDVFIKFELSIFNHSLVKPQIYILYPTHTYIYI